MPRRKGPGGRRKGAGRPPLGADKREVVRTVKLTQAEADAQDAFASRAGQTWTAMAREAIETAIARGSTR